MKTLENKINLNNNLSKYWVIPIILFSLVFIFDVRFFKSPPLYCDDWSLLYGNIINRGNFFNITDRRPLVGNLLFLLAPVFGTKIIFYYLFNYLLILSSGICYYLILNKAFPVNKLISLLTVILFLIYPINFTKIWLTMQMIHFALLINLFVIFLLLSYSDNNNLWKVGLANLLFIFSLLIYEGGLGIVMLAAVLLAFNRWKLSKRQSLTIFSVFITGFIFIIWRVIIQPGLFNIQDNYLPQINTSIPTIIYRYIQGAFIALYNWVGPLLHGLGQRKYLIFVSLSVIIFGIISTILIRHINHAKSNETFLWINRKKKLYKTTGIFIIAILFWAAGYFPIISYRGPAFYGLDSRFNLFATLGAALAFVSGISLILTIVIKKKDWINIATVLALIPFILLGTFYQLWSQEERFNTWDLQKQFWQSMFDEVPNLKEGTHVVVAISGYEELEQFEFLPFVGNWEARSALRILYNNDNLNAQYYYLDRVDGGGYDFPENVDFSKYLFVLYEPDIDQFKIIEDVVEIFPNKPYFDVYDPFNRIIEANFSTYKYRFLVD